MWVGLRFGPSFPCGSVRLGPALAQNLGKTAKNPPDSVSWWCPPLCVVGTNGQAAGGICILAPWRFGLSSSPLCLGCFPSPPLAGCRFSISPLCLGGVPLRLVPPFLVALCGWPHVYLASHHTMTLCDFTLFTFKALWILPGSFFRVALRVCLCRCPPFTAVEGCAGTYRPANLWTCFRAFALSRFHAFALSLVCVVRLCCSLALCVLALRSTSHHTLALCDFTLFTLKALLI
jgi:hypothetical protein